MVGRMFLIHKIIGSTPIIPNYATMVEWYTR